MDSGPVVSNTSPLIKLAGVDLLDVLPALYGTIWIPDAVRAEFAAGAGAHDPDLATLPWIQVQSTAPLPDLASMQSLGRGEAEAISLAETQHARVMLLDDKLARKVARARGLPVVGTLAVLLRAKQAQLIPEVRPVVDRMIAQGRRVSADLRRQLLRDAGEVGD